MSKCRQCSKESEVLDEFGFCSEFCHKGWKEEHYGKLSKKRKLTIPEMQARLIEMGRENKDKRNHGQTSIL